MSSINDKIKKFHQTFRYANGGEYHGAIRLRRNRTESPGWYEQRIYELTQQIEAHYESPEDSTLWDDFRAFGSVMFPGYIDICYFPSRDGKGIGLGSSSRHQARDNVELWTRLQRWERRNKSLLKTREKYRAVFLHFVRENLPHVKQAIESGKTQGQLNVNGRAYQIQAHWSKYGGDWEVEWPEFVKFELNLS